MITPLTAFENVTLTVTPETGDPINISVSSEAKPELTITADSAEKVYDGTELTKATYTFEGLAEDDTIKSVTMTVTKNDGSGVEEQCVNAGTSANVPSGAVIKNANNEDVTAKYAISYVNGTLTVTQKPLTITADTDAKVYDGTVLMKNSYTNTALAAGDSIESVNVTGSQTVVGSSDNVPSAAKIVNDKGEDVTANYNITYANGTLEVTQKALTITADSEEKAYDGTALKKDSYVTDGVNKETYYNHGIANRPFGTGSGENLGKFVNDRDNTLTGIQGPDGLIMWPGKDMLIQVYQNKADKQGYKTTPVGGAKFSLATDDTESVTLWTGESNPATGLVTIPWGVSESLNGQTVTFTRKTEGSASSVSYILSQQQANKDTVRPAGTWRMTIGANNAVTWEVIPPAEDTTQSDPQGNAGESEAPKVNRTLNVVAKDGAYLGEIFLLYNDVKPMITFDPNGGVLSGNADDSIRVDTIDFSDMELSHTYKITEPNPTLENSVFRIWSTVKNPKEGDGHKEYKQGDEMLFYRHTDDDDLTLYALWETVVCKITDRNDNLLYVNGSPAVYNTLKDGFDAFNEASFTLKNGTTRGTPRKLKMLVPTYELPETVELARGKTCEFMTASNDDTDGYRGPTTTCVITRASSFDSGSMIIDNYNLVLRDIILDGAVKDNSGTVKPVAGNGGIATVTGNASHLTLAQGAVLRNSTVSGNGGAIYADANTIVTVSDGSITDCQAANGGAIYSDASGAANNSNTVSISGGTISGNKAVGTNAAAGIGGAVYAMGGVKVTLNGGRVDNNTAETKGGALYLAKKAELAMTSGSINGNSAANGGGVYSDGDVTLSKSTAVIDGNKASENGGGVYIGESGSLNLSAGAIGGNGSANTAAKGGGVYLEGSARLIGGSISYNAAENSGDGGGLYIASGLAIALSGTEFSHNTAANGGAIYASGAAGGANLTLTLDGSTVSNNQASVNGGGVYLASGVRFDVTGGTLENNTAQYGGGAYAASGSEMCLKGGTVSDNHATANGGAVCVEGSTGANFALRMESGSIVNNNADNLGGAVFLQNYGRLHVSGGTISYNSAKNENGGAVNADGTDARIYLSGSPTIFNNPGNAATVSQKNLVLSVDQNTIINTEENGLKDRMTRGIGGTIGVYVIGSTNDDTSIYANHGVYDKPFGTFGGTSEDRTKASHLVNDRNLGLYGVQKENNTIYWLDVVCKITNANNEILYKLVNVDNSGVSAYVPAIYTSLKDGLAAVSGNLYRKSGNRYATANTGAVKVKMLKDYALNGEEILIYNTSRDVTLTTAETSISSAMLSNGDTYIYQSQSSATSATLTRAQSTASMFTVNTNHRFDVSNLIIDGGSNTMMTTSDVNGGAFDIEAVASSTFTGVKLQNLNATGNGGAIYLKAGTLTLNNTEVTGSAANNGGALYIARSSTGTPATVTMSSGKLSNNTAQFGGGAYVGVNSALKLSGSAEISANSATSQDNGGVYIAGEKAANETVSSGKVHVQGSVKITGNKAGTVASNLAIYDDTSLVVDGNLTTSADIRVCTLKEDDSDLIGVEDGVKQNLNTIKYDRDLNIYGGALYVTNGAKLELTGGEINGNSATDGGGVYVDNGTMNMTATAGAPGMGPSIKNCTAVLGGGIYETGENASVIIRSGEISGNTATGMGGGALRLEEGARTEISGTAEIKNNKVTNNEPGTDPRRFGGAVNIRKGHLTISGGTISGNGVETTNAKGYGGAITVGNNSILDMTGGVISGNYVKAEGENAYAYGGAISIDGSRYTSSDTANSTVNISGGTIEANEVTAPSGNAFGGAVSVLYKGHLTITGGTITGNNAANGGAVFVDKDGTMTLKDGTGAGAAATHGTITGNTATANGAGIYLEEGGTLKMSDSPDFGGNVVTIDGYADKQNGGDRNAYTDDQVRQDVYVKGYLGKTGDDPTNATSIVVTGALSSESGDGFIWVWAEKPNRDEPDNHYEMLKQFAVYADGVKADLTEEQLATTPHAFRNAQDDEITGCGADYLTGQDGDKENCIYWTGGFDFVFKKIGPDGKKLDDAVFTLYKANEKGTAILTDDDDERVAYEVTASGGTKIGKLPYGTYYLHETVVPGDYKKLSETDGNWFILTVSEDGVGYLAKGATKPNNEINAEEPKP